MLWIGLLVEEILFDIILSKAMRISRPTYGYIIFVSYSVSCILRMMVQDMPYQGWPLLAICYK